MALLDLYGSATSCDKKREDHILLIQIRMLITSSLVLFWSSTLRFVKNQHTINSIYPISILTHHIWTLLPLFSFTLSLISEGKPFSWRHGGGLATCKCLLFCQGTQCFVCWKNLQPWVKKWKEEGFCRDSMKANQKNGFQEKIGTFFWTSSTSIIML